MRGPRPLSKGPFPADLRARFAHAHAMASPGALGASSALAPPARAASDLAPCDWQAKFDAIKVDSVTKAPLWGEISRVAALVPAVAKETLRRRYAERDISATKMGPSPTLGVYEEDMVEYLKAYKSMGVHVYHGIVCDKARRLSKAAGIEWDFVASRPWLDAFCARHGLDLRKGQFLEKERAHAVSRDALGRWFDVLEVAQEGVLNKNKYMLDEVHVNLLDTGGYRVSQPERARVRARVCVHTSNRPLIPPQVFTFGAEDYPSIPKPETSKHITFLACVNAEGVDSTPALVFQGVRAMSKFSSEWPEVLLGMDPAGYMSCELFLTWAKRWEETTRPADGAPRLLLFDGHFSHMAIDAVVYLGKHNVRVVTVHPHTTHLTCVLDNGPFKRFNWFLKEEVALLSPPGTAVSDSNIAGIVRRAWQKTLKITPHPKSGKPSNPVISAFEKTGIAPFSRHLMEKDIFSASDAYKKERDATGKVGEPSAKRPKLAVDAAARDALKKAILNVEFALPADLDARIKGSSRTRWPSCSRVPTGWRQSSTASKSPRTPTTPRRRGASPRRLPRSRAVA